MKKLSRVLASRSLLLIAFTLALAATFKLSAFARETFIASRFGLSSVTDAYFSLQQLPLAVASFMFGPFCRAFTPSYADARSERAKVEWLPGLMFYGTLLGLVLTVLALSCAPLTLRLFTRSTQNDGWPTLAVMSFCYWPIIQIGISAGIATSYGRNLASLTITGLPYLLMSLAIGLMYLTGNLNGLSLPLSMTAGFVLSGILSFVGVVGREKPFRHAVDLLCPWRQAAFRAFAGQLAVSSIENVGYSVNQMLILFFMARAGTGAITANNCAGRIGLLGFSLLVQPLSQLMQARLCTTTGEAQKRTFQSYLLMMAVGASTLSLAVCVFRYKVAALIYMHGKFSAAALHQVAALLPAWLTYFVILSLNVVVGQYLFRTSKGRTFTRNMLCGYGLANAIRFATMGAGSPWIIWCSVIGDGSALIANLVTSAESWRPSLRPEAVAEVQEV
jgi:putative peptidoglycan lipid II flippase